jgi:hypothetical protein
MLLTIDVLHFALALCSGYSTVGLPIPLEASIFGQGTGTCNKPKLSQLHKYKLELRCDLDQKSFI